MNRKIFAALIILLLTALILVFNTKGPKLEIDLIVKTVKATKSIIFLGFTAAGVAVGMLIK